MKHRQSISVSNIPYAEEPALPPPSGDYRLNLLMDYDYCIAKGDFNPRAFITIENLLNGQPLKLVYSFII